MQTLQRIICKGAVKLKCIFLRPQVIYLQEHGLKGILHVCIQRHKQDVYVATQTSSQKRMGNTHGIFKQGNEIYND